jgi:hypothetical protein
MTLILTASALVLGACASAPDLRLRRVAPPPATTPEPMPLPPGEIEPGTTPSAGAAEAACMAKMAANAPVATDPVSVFQTDMTCALPAEMRPTGVDPPIPGAMCRFYAAREAFAQPGG